MTRVAAAILVAVLGAFPLSVLFAPPITWLAVAALVVGGTGVVLLSIPLVTAGASVALIEYSVALVMAEAAVDLVAALTIAATLVVLLALVHLASHLQDAAVAGSIIVAQLGQWLVIAAIGVATAVVLSAGAGTVGGALRGAAAPIVVLAAALGALLTVAGVIALLTNRESN